jgi:hypothetical protein
MHVYVVEKGSKGKCFAGIVLSVNVKSKEANCYVYTWPKTSNGSWMKATDHPWIYGFDEIISILKAPLRNDPESTEEAWFFTDLHHLLNTSHDSDSDSDLKMN